MMSAYWTVPGCKESVLGWRPSALHLQTPRTVADEHAVCSVACAPPSVHVTPTVAQLRWLQPKLDFFGVCRPLSQRLHLPSLLLVSLTAVSCTVIPDLITEWRHRSPHSHLAGAEGCDRTFTRLNGPAWPLQSTPGMQQPPTRLI